MSKNLIWSPLAESDLENILSYLQTNWSSLVITDFLDRIDNLISQIANHPKQFPVVN